MRQALHAMAADPGLTWWLLPGNHDSLAAGDLWQRIARDAPPNVRPLVAPAPVEIAPGAWLLPAPCTQRRPGRDLTAGMADAATPAGALRIGLAHGAVQSFSEDGNPALIPPDRAETAGLAFLALGDWHGQLRIGPRTWYAGAPEADGFKHATAPGALLVDLAGAGAGGDAGPDRHARLARAPRSTSCRATTRTRASRPCCRRWRRAATRCSASPPPAAPASPARRRSAVALAAVEHDFAFLDLDRSGLAIDHAPADLDAFGAPGTALRAAADALRAEADDPALPDEDRAAALTALSRLYAFAGDAA